MASSSKATITRRVTGSPVAPLQLPALAGAGALRSTAADLLCCCGPPSTLPNTPLAAELERTQLPGSGWSSTGRSGLAG
jgi:hypothetical protein